MPQIIVAADHGAAFGEGAVTLREGVTVADFESEHFATQLVERLGWAVEDADQLEQVPNAAESRAQEPDSVRRGRAQEPDAVRRHRAAESDPVRRERADEPDSVPRKRTENREPVTAR